MLRNCLQVNRAGYSWKVEWESWVSQGEKRLATECSLGGLHGFKGSCLQKPKTHLPNALQGCPGYIEENELLLGAGGWNGNEFRTPGFLSLSGWEREQDNSLLLEKSMETN